MGLELPQKLPSVQCNQRLPRIRLVLEGSPALVVELARKLAAVAAAVLLLVGTAPVLVRCHVVPEGQAEAEPGAVVLDVELELPGPAVQLTESAVAHLTVALQSLGVAVVQESASEH